MINELSVIIPAYNEEHYLPKLLESISIQNFPDKLEVIVVNGKSEDKTVEVAKKYQKKIKDLVILNSKRDIGTQRNIGAKKAKYKYLLFIDADMILPKNFFEKLLKKINPHNNFLTMVTIWPASKRITDWLVIFLAYPFMYLIYLLKPTSPGGFTLTTKKNHIAIGGYAEGAVFGEDTDYGHRAVANGARPHIYASPVVYHSVRRVREMGMIGLLIYWLRAYIQVRQKGVLSSKTFHYPYGHYEGDKE